MEKRIFDLGLSVEAISLYLIMADLKSADVPLTREPVVARWTGSEEKLEQSIGELEMQNVISQSSDTYEILPVERWREMGRA